MASAPRATPRKESARRPKTRTGRALDFDDDEEKIAKPTAAVTRESSGSSVQIEKNDRNASTAYKWFREDPDRFAKYRNYIKNDSEELTSEIQRHGKTKKADVAKWVLSNVGFIPDTDTRTVTIQNIIDIAIVAAGLTNHGVAKLQREFDAGNMDNLQNTTFHAYNLRSSSSQQDARKHSKAKDMQKKHAAHYVGLEVGMRLNNALPPPQRVDSDDLRHVLNLRTNLQVANAKTNLTLHKQIDRRLLDASDCGTLTREEYDRLEQIVKKAQSDKFQQAMLSVSNGRHLYLALRDRISNFDTGDRPRLWDARQDPRGLQRPSSVA